jgi:hypothetical protein
MPLASRRKALGGGFRGAENGHPPRVETVALVLVSVITFASIVLVLALFVWAARKDGEEDRALQARLGIRRRTRLGR